MEERGRLGGMEGWEGEREGERAMKWMGGGACLGLDFYRGRRRKN